MRRRWRRNPMNGEMPEPLATMTIGCIGDTGGLNLDFRTLHQSLGPRGHGPSWAWCILSRVLDIRPSSRSPEARSMSLTATVNEIVLGLTAGEEAIE